MARVPTKRRARAIGLSTVCRGMDTTQEPAKKRRRTNAEILADMKAEKAAPKKRVRRTNSQIARDKEKARLAELAARPPKTVKVVHFLTEVTVFGRTWSPGDEIYFREGTIYHGLAFDKNNTFILNKTVEQQKKLWGKVKYVVREEPIDEQV